MEKRVTKNTYLGIFYDETEKSLCSITKQKVNPMNIKGMSVMYEHSEISYIFEYKNPKCSKKLELDAFDIKQYLNLRIRCPQFKEHTEKCRGHQYISVYAKGNSNRFYCKAHPKRPHNKYEFRKEPSVIDTLQKLLKELQFYDELHSIYTAEKISYNINEDSKNLLKACFQMNLPLTIVAKIFHSSRPTITKLKKQFNDKEPSEDKQKKENLKDVKIISYKTSDVHQRLFYTKVKVSQKDLNSLKVFFGIEII